MRVMATLMILGASAAMAQDLSVAPEAGATPVAAAATPPAASPAASPDAAKAMAGMSILGNEETPKSLVIVPWKSSRLGDEPGVDNALDERPRPLDKEVFMRELRYYALQTGSE
jgi:hypothetical protein